jgi:hypothetical protein
MELAAMAPNNFAVTMRAATARKSRKIRQGIVFIASEQRSI